jgi:phosphomannomutase
VATEKVENSYLSDQVTMDHLDGLTVNGDTWWFNLRPSNTEPLLRLNVEASTQAQMETVRDAVLSLIRG